jgi:hypothetical protein
LNLSPGEYLCCKYYIILSRAIRKGGFFVAGMSIYVMDDEPAYCRLSVLRNSHKDNRRAEPCKLLYRRAGKDYRKLILHEWQQVPDK